ncbi:MAG: hypothetical protein UX91_C0001G0071 [Candidatus Amesbacteria bacterium GW2011_GWB1_47_19]|nr:MAG: hypothetical protein UW51_C0001G0071 [Candidatus Amesbacteria bacterium GW2011_GWA1_44_24]KKU32083.1 MAG: hypothetical protein UX46_C0001G0070 [Candidatus Amesbacteria bacterium GW2011_GWC1_46_24]KKU67767.1 MAG: hypothetical protein UX91_C0001G0071 [Candidatus Amesbacteria bacterium GW2011_GWB1_47_19]
MWGQLIADIKFPAEADKISESIFSTTELLTIIKRLGVAYWLSKGRSYENIKQNLKVSSATIASIQQELKKPGWKLALEKVMAEEWASKWEEKIKNLFKRDQSKN